MKPIKHLLSLLFSLVIRLRHQLFDWGIIKSTAFDVPIICVGNLKVGGTGKTPMTNLLVSELKSKYRVAVLSRGYRRKTKGFVLANSASTSKDIGDEPMLIHGRHPEVTVAVCEKRVEGVAALLKHDPTINLIILDDAFQHRYITTSLDILLTEYDRPYYDDYLLPFGSLRDVRKQARRASILVVTKCPADVSPIQLRTMMLRFDPKPYQSVFFTYMREGDIFPLFDRGYEEPIKSIMKGSNVILTTAIANPQHLVASLERDYNLCQSYRFRDHHNYSQSDIDKIIASAKETNSHIVMTEKDATKIIALNIPQEERFRFHVASITTEFISEKKDNKSYFIKCITDRIRISNGKYCFKHTQFNL